MSVFDIQPRIQKEFQCLEEQTFEDPWGLGYRLTILRATHPDWDAWKEEHLDDGEFRTILEDAYTEVIVSHQPRPGFRRRSRGQIQPDELKRALNKVKGDRRLLKAQQDELEVLRPGIAAVLLRRAVLTVDGVEHVAGDEDKLHMLESDSTNRIPEGLELPYEGNTVGDALALFILDASEWTEAFRSDWTEDASKNSETTPDGSSAIGQGSTGAISAPSSAAQS